MVRDLMTRMGLQPDSLFTNNHSLDFHRGYVGQERLHTGLYSTGSPVGKGKTVVYDDVAWHPEFRDPKGSHWKLFENAKRDDHVWVCTIQYATDLPVSRLPDYIVILRETCEDNLRRCWKRWVVRVSFKAFLEVVRRVQDEAGHVGLVISTADGSLMKYCMLELQKPGGSQEEAGRQPAADIKLADFRSSSQTSSHDRCAQGPAAPAGTGE